MVSICEDCFIKKQDKIFSMALFYILEKKMTNDFIRWYRGNFSLKGLINDNNCNK